jgi:hypothetical protein
LASDKLSSRLRRLFALVRVQSRSRGSHSLDIGITP